MGAEKEVYGEVLAFRGFLHAPANEAAVVCLFGALAWELGFWIDRIRRKYPDCEAKRLVDPVTKQWEKCMIEFEFRARNFELHGHDPAEVDLIVCWENNWTGAPVDVLALKSVVMGLAEASDPWKLGALMDRGMCRASVGEK